MFAAQAGAAKSATLGVFPRDQRGQHVTAVTGRRQCSLIPRSMAGLLCCHGAAIILAPPPARISAMMRPPHQPALP